MSVSYERGDDGSVGDRHVDVFGIEVERPARPLRAQVCDRREAPFEVAGLQPDEMQLGRVALIDVVAEPRDGIRRETPLHIADRHRQKPKGDSPLNVPFRLCGGGRRAREAV
jgi:hypothetical protein